MTMDIIFISFWSLNDPLTLSTVFPNIQLLVEHSQINLIHFITIERTNKSTLKKKKITLHQKIIHLPIYERNNYICKALTPLKILYYISSFRKNSISLIIARSSLAAIPAYFANVLFKLKFTVESYEPHSRYMVDNGVWNEFGLKYNFLKLIEEKIETFAFKLYPVSNNFKNSLIEKGVSNEKVSIIPCSVNQSVFAYNPKKREEIRNKLNLTDDCVVAINVGKFGGIYYDTEALLYFQKAKDAFNNFHLILLSPENKNILSKKLLDKGFCESDFTIKHASFIEVPNYLSAADFAFAMIKPTKSSHAMSPIKIGEYYASGLPIVITPNIGDDSDIILTENAGEIINVFGENEFLKIKKILNCINHRNRISNLASNYRSHEVNRINYNRLIEEIEHLEDEEV